LIHFYKRHDNLKEFKMSVMKTFCGCVSTKTGSLAILAFYIIVAIGQVVLCSLKIDSGDYGKMQEENGLPEECLSGDNNGTWWCKIIKNDDNIEESVVITKIVINIAAFLTCLVAFIGVSYDKKGMMMPFIIFEFLSIALWIALEVLTVLVMAVYLTTSVDITTTVSVAVIMAIWTVLLFYLWLCVVSHYQILGEVMSMGSDKVKVLQEWEDDQAINRYDRFGDGSDGPDPHEDDYPTSGPPSYVSQEDVTKIDDVDIEASSFEDRRIE